MIETSVERMADVVASATECGLRRRIHIGRLCLFISTGISGLLCAGFLVLWALSYAANLRVIWFRPTVGRDTNEAWIFSRWGHLRITYEYMLNGDHQPDPPPEFRSRVDTAHPRTRSEWQVAMLPRPTKTQRPPAYGVWPPHFSSYRVPVVFGYSYWYLNVPHWIFVVTTGALPCLVTLRASRKRRSKHRLQRLGLCPACAYDLRATPTRCPECGWNADPSTSSPLPSSSPQTPSTPPPPAPSPAPPNAPIGHTAASPSPPSLASAEHRT